MALFLQDNVGKVTPGR